MEGRLKQTQQQRVHDGVREEKVKNEDDETSHDVSNTKVHTHEGVSGERYHKVINRGLHRLHALCQFITEKRRLCPKIIVAVLANILDTHRDF